MFCGEIRDIFTGYPPLSRPMAHYKERSAEDFMMSVFNDAYAILSSDFLLIYKSICCAYSFELPQHGLVETLHELSKLLTGKNRKNM